MSNTLVSDIVQHSVTQDEQNYTKPSGGFVKMLVGYSTGGISVVLKNLPDLPPFWSTQRDDILASTVQESRWAQAVGIAVMKFCSRSWDIDGNVPFLRKERARTIIRGYDYVGQVSRGFTDYLLRDNGWWIEIVRQSSAAGSKVLGLNYLSSARCYPTGNPDIPVIYWDRLGKYHELRQHQVIRLVDMPDGNNILGVGMCAARRAYNDIRNYAAVMRYRLEKMTGARPLSIYFITGVTKEQIQSATMSAREAREAEGIVAFGGAAIVPFMQRENISQVEIPLSSLPDQFNYKDETSEADTAYANALPLVISLDLRAMTGQRAGSGAQSQVIDDHAIVKEAVLRDFAQKMNNEDVWHVLPAGTSFYFVKNDLVDRKREADIVNAYVTAAGLAVTQMGLDPEKAVEWLADKDVFPSQWGVGTESQSGTLDEAENIETNGEKLPSVISGPPEQTPATGNEPKPMQKPSVTKPKPKPQPATAKKEADEEEEDVKASEALAISMQALYKGIEIGQGMGGSAQKQSGGGGINFHLDNVRMDAPEEMKAAFERMQSPQVHVEVAPPQNVINIPQAPAPITPVTVNLPETQITVQSATPDVKVIVPQVAEEEKTIEVAQRDANGFMERLVQRTRRTFSK